MRRSFPAAAVAAVGVVLAAIALLHSGDSSSYRVNAVFDTAKGIVPGQLVKIAGVRVGTVTDVKLTADRKARITLKVKAGFAPFRSDASCRILPEGLISENFVECTPGSSSRPLAAGPGGTPTVPVQHTTVPVELQDVINVFSLPVDKQIGALVNELGIATAGRGDDLNAILRRANPALTDARRALTLLADQRRQIADAVSQTDTVLASLAAGRNDVSRFVTNAGAVAGTTAGHAAPLAAAVRDLPPMLASVDRGLRSVRRITATGTPLLRELRTAAPALNTFAHAIVPFARQGEPAVKRIGAVTEKGRTDLRAATPVFGHLSDLAASLQPAARQVALLVDSMTKQGGTENVMKFFYQMAAMSGGYDSTSHFVAVLINVWANCLLNLATKGCSQAYSAPGGGTIPANAPSVGPQRLGTVLEPGAPVLRSTQMEQLAKQHPERIKALLDLLLK
ncbi:MlaD family protein [Paraconexibacter antarcticus]|uniref:MlaD family protein n=1 Tax=Paraconexibacter antarcticus TaxID=2949664 RepID=A0ABY5E1Q9_9ACTN|nr:MlaD family protein [Paraconexibacter antarcticus]UTI66750.1 MlaD family protein [Paraconexibacter antarcticus]